VLPLGILAHPILKPLSNARGSREPRRKAKVEPCNFPRDPILGGQCAFPLARVLLEGGQEGSVRGQGAEEEAVRRDAVSPVIDIAESDREVIAVLL